MSDAERSRIDVRYMAAIRGLFASQLAVRCRRPVEDVRDRGLGATDFHGNESIQVRFRDGSTMSLQYAFAVEDRVAISAQNQDATVRACA